LGVFLLSGWRGWRGMPPRLFLGIFTNKLSKKAVLLAFEFRADNVIEEALATQ
jgi:hypothetical protein